MSESLFTSAELREMHAQIAKLRAQTTLISTETPDSDCATNQNTLSPPPLKPLAHFCQMMLYSLCLYATVGVILVTATHYLR